MEGTSFALAMGEDASKTTQPIHSGMIAQAEDQAALQAGKSASDAPHASDLSSEGEGLPVIQATEAKDTHKTSTTPDGQIGQRVDVGTASGNSAEHTRNTSRDEADARFNQLQKASPISAMIQGLSQPNQATDAAAAGNPNEAESKAHRKPATEAGMTGTEQQTTQGGEPKESTPTDSSKKSTLR